LASTDSPVADLRAPSVSILIAVYNEADNVEAVCDEIITAFAAGPEYEVLFVDDGSTDDTVERIQSLSRANPSIRLLRHDRRCGKSTALRTGVAGAHAPWIATMDGDGQNDPRDIPAMLRLAWEADGAAPLVAGIRSRRRDPLSRRIATRFANGLRQKVLQDHCPDTGCGMKVFRGEDFARLPAFEGMHRFFPALFQLYGHPLICHEVTHRPRASGRSKYSNFGRAMVGIGDLLCVVWLRHRTTLPGRVSEG
jgi:dolichol-phosphate mannosyltransferase